MDDDRGTEVSWRPARPRPHGDEPGGGASAYREAVMTAATRASRLLLEADTLWSALPGALGVLAEAAGMDRILLRVEGPIEEGARTGHRAVGEWTAPGIPTHADVGLAEQANDDFPDLVARLHAGRSYWIHLEDVRDRGRDNFQRLHIRTTTGFPLFVEGRYVGALAFDDCRARREYRAYEAEALEAAAGVVAEALHRDRLAEALARERERAAQERAAEAEHLSALLQGVVAASRALLDEPSLEEGLRRWSGLLAAASGADRAGVGLFVEEDGQPTPRPVNFVDWARDGLQPLDGVHVPRSSDLDAWGERLRRGEAVWAEYDERADPASREYRDRSGCRAHLIVPMMVDGRAWGWLYLDFAEPRPSRPADVAVLRTAAGGAASAIRRDQAARASLRDRSAREHAERERAAELARRNALLETATELSRILIDAATLDAAADEVLAILGRRLCVDRAALGVLTPTGDGGFWCELVHEWSSPGTPRRMDDPALVRTRLAGSAEDVARFLRGEVVQGGVELPEPVRGEQRATGAPWQFALPIILDGAPWGVLGFDDCTHPRRWDAGEIAFLEGVAAALSAAAQREHAERKHRESVAREREMAAEKRAAELVRANDALQSTVDAVASVDDLDELIPTVLRIVAAAFGARDCAFYEHPMDAPIRLRYWYLAGRVLRPEELAALDEKRFGLVRRLAAGFTVPPEHLGAPFRTRTHATVLDHSSANTVPEFHHFAVSNGWGTELNVPVVVGGKADGALIIYRPSGAAFTDAEIALSEALAKQLALAVNARRLAEGARETAVAREREQAARGRAAELARANDALRRGVERLVEARSIDAIRDVFVLEAIRASGATAGALLRRVAGTEFEFAPVADRDGVVSSAYAAGFIASIRETSRRDPAGVFARLAAGEPVLSRVEELAGWYPEAAEFHRAQGSDAVWNIPFTAGGEVAGYLGLSFPAGGAPDRVVLETLRALASQASMALETARLAEEGREAAVAREREIAAEERAGELARANAALSSAVISTAEDSDFAAVLGRCVASVVEVSGASYGQLFRYNDVRNTLESAFWVEDGVLHEGYDPGAPPLLRGPFDADVTPAFRVYVELREIMTADLRTADPALLAAAWPGVVEWHLEHGRGWSCAIPVLAGPVALGMLGLAWREPVSFSAAQRELLFALASQAALVMQLAELASATREAAVAREQERAARERVDELAKANQALRAGVDEMAGSGTATGILTAFLRQAVRATEGRAGAVLLRAGDTTRFDLTAVYSNGATLDTAEVARHPIAREIRDASTEDRTGYFASLARGEMQWRSIASPLADELPRVTEHYLRAGGKTIWAVPFAIRGEVRGYLSVVFREHDRPPPVVTEAVVALATQVGLALELTRLADEAREAAVAREREVAAEERAAELGRANEVVRGTLSTLADGRSVDAFVASVLEESVRQTGALDSVLYLYDSDADTLRASATRLRDGAADAHEIQFLVPMPAAHAGAWRMLLDAPSPLLVHPVEDPLTWPQTLDTHRAMGHGSLGYFLVRVGERPLGFVALAWADVEPDLPPERVGVVAALAQQLALALELDRLARQGRHAAVLEERTRLAREIHDTLAHGLAGIAVTLEGARGILVRDPARGVAHVDAALALARESLADARHALHTLRPVGSTRVGLGDALQQLAARFNGHNGTAVRVEAQEMPLPLTEEAEVELLRIAQEAVSNAVRHARARWARVTLEASQNGDITLRVSDDGRGFDLSALQPSHMVGITGMRERAARVGGALAVLSRPGEGTDVVVIVPSRPVRRATGSHR